MNDQEIIKLWESDNNEDRVKSLLEIEKLSFKIGEEFPAWVRKILAHAMYHDYRKYVDGYEIWIHSLCIAGKLCDKYGWDFGVIVLSSAEVEMIEGG